MKEIPSRLSPLDRRRLTSLPQENAREDFEKIYFRNKIVIGSPIEVENLTARDNTLIIVGGALGDEGKGRIVDNKIKSLLEISGVKIVNVVRYQGGNNAGHTVEKDGVKIDLHLVPSGVMYQETVGIMDQGMVIHAEDLQTEIGYVEEKVGDLRGKIFLSEDAILTTDIERAEEVDRPFYV